MIDFDDPANLEIEVTMIRETAKAWLVAPIEEEDNEQWVPKSQCRLLGTTLQIPEWLADEKGFA